MELVGILIGFWLGRKIKGITKKIVNLIICSGDMSLELTSNIIQRKSIIFSFIKNTVAVLTMLFTALGICGLITIFYMIGYITLPSDSLHCLLSIVKKATITMPLSLYIGLIVQLAIEGTQKNGRIQTVLLTTRSMINSLLHRTYRHGDWEHLRNLYRVTALNAKNDFKLRYNGLRKEIRERPTDCFWGAVILVCAGIFSICLFKACINIWEGSSVLLEVTTGVIFLFFGIVCILNYVRVQVMEDKNVVSAF